MSTPEKATKEEVKLDDLHSVLAQMDKFAEALGPEVKGQPKAKTSECQPKSLKIVTDEDLDGPCPNGCGHTLRDCNCQDIDEDVDDIDDGIKVMLVKQGSGYQCPSCNNWSDRGGYCKRCTNDKLNVVGLAYWFDSYCQGGARIVLLHESDKGDIVDNCGNNQNERLKDPKVKVIYGDYDRVVERLEKEYPPLADDLVRIVGDFQLHKYPCYTGSSVKKACQYAMKYRRIDLLDTELIGKFGDAERKHKQLAPAVFYTYANSIKYEPSRQTKNDKRINQGEFTREQLQDLLYGINETLWAVYGKEIPCRHNWIDRRPLVITGGYSPTIASLTPTCGVALQMLQGVTKKRSAKLKRFFSEHKAMCEGHIKNQKTPLSKALKAELQKRR